jgi:murein DD-endopeptidase MepM/ murein hydrolase activator NlpD
MDKKLIFVVALLLPFFASCSAPVGIVKNNVELPQNDKPEIKLAKLDPSAMEQLQHEQDGAFHVAGAGETLKQVCEVYGLDLVKVAKINKIESPYSLKEGDAIFLPAQALLPDEKTKAESGDSDKGSKSCGVKRATRQTVVNALLGKKDPNVPVLKFPVPKGVLTSPFGYRWGRFHKGLDIAAPIGSPVLSCADGKIVFTGTRKRFRRYGNTVLVDHGNGAYTYYAHLSEILVKKGQLVRKGQKIALVGNSGRSTGPHCHLEVRVANTMYNPLAYFSPQEITGTLMTARFRETPMGPIRAKWRIPDLLTASK